MSADGPRAWVANMDRDIKAKSGGHESTSVYPGASSTRSGTCAFELNRELDVGSAIW